jgi:hypothetical protein
MSNSGRKVILKPGFARQQFAAAALMTALLGLAAQARGADFSLPVTGDILGRVVDASGIPQLGATVNLYNRYDRLIRKTMTGIDGRFAFPSLPADIYSVRVSLASFLPASRSKIAIRPGMESLLEVHLATLFSNVRVKYSAPTASMTEEWKWVLRSSPATRLITRYAPDDQETELHPRVFSGTHAVVSVAGSDSGLIDSDSLQGDMGTGFILSTNILGKNQVQVAGTYGPAANLGPASMGLCAIYSRGDEGGLAAPPEIALTISQFGLFAGPSQPGPNAQPAMVRIMSLSTYQVADAGGVVHVEYGATGESVDFGSQHRSRVSPYARATVSAGEFGQVSAAFSDGGRPAELLSHQQQPLAPESGSDELAAVANGLASMPEVSSANGNLELQRTRSYEIGFNKVSGSRTYAVSGFREEVWNGWINMGGNLNAIPAGDLLSDGISQTSVYDIGRYARNGYLASVNQKAGEYFDLAMAFGRMDGFTRDADSLGAALNGNSSVLSERQDNLAVANVKATAPKSGTQIWASYGWFANGMMVPEHSFVTQTAYVEPGLNIFIRQPLPSLFGIPGRIELTADLQNLLAQGYVPLGSVNGRTILVVQAPRAVRGGVNFVF